MLFLSEQRINIGVNQHAGPEQRHGVLWAVVTKDGVAENIRYPLIIDKPHLVCEGLNFATWRRIKKQIKKMGIEATHIELLFHAKKFPDAGHFCYLLSEYKELYNAKNKGRPIYQNGYT